ncbi:stemmadenine O-acetyltransferase-like [Juglans microcarpa x Juglans regia]|uniref:stemmadenine O-acetyltransferase-like n=1 Tax=Juglans microcarpa x Juglans regia TaxID=2249226 RepID=UPI001B7E7B37|nr:stemmadenine O-acetyltransferase-like [Juglans microcarpa x Juglans regia]
MKVDVEVISQETVKPSSLTPHHLRHYTLSFIDQTTPQIFMPLVLFYSSDVNIDPSSVVDCQERIKKSLSEALVLFYPLAGRVKDNYHVECNDGGVHYVEAKVNCTLSEFLEDPNPSELIKFLPYDLDDCNELPMAVQVNSFNCGGIVIGLVFAHKVLDASSLFLFLNNWAAIARGGSNIVTPLFESAMFFPPKAFPTYNPSRGTGKIKIAIKRFVFDSSAIERLKAKYSSDNLSTEYPGPIRVEALSTFIFSRLLAATRVEEDPNKSYAIFQVANLRTRMNPPLSENYFGNMILGTGSVICRDTVDSFHDIIIPVRDALRKVDMNFAKRFQESGANLTFLLQNKDILKKGEVIMLVFTSLCRFPAYKIDFGWGKPVWVGSVRLLFKNLVTFFDTKAGSGIEVWINLDEQDMAKFEVDMELLDYVSSRKISVD